MCAKRQFDALSTVTDLISVMKDRNAQQHRENMPMAEISSNESKKRTRNSSSNKLKDYIKDYDRSQTFDFADVLTQNLPLALQAEDKENVIQKEIDFAKSLLESSCSSLVNESIRSLNTDDLLMMDPSTMAGFEKLDEASLSQGYKVESCFNPVLKSTARCPTLTSMHYSDRPISNRKNLRPKQSRSLYDGDTTTTTESSTLDLFSLNGMHYTPHSIKYRSILAEGSHHESSNSESDAIFQREKSSGKPSSGTLSPTLPGNLHLHAGRTPFKSQKLWNRRLSSGTMSLSKGSDDQFSQDDTTSLSCSHYSVPLNMNGQTPQMTDFMRECLNVDDDSSSHVPSGSVETLKNMLFMLQTMTSDSSINNDDFSSSGQNVSPDGPTSLKRAISHLTTLRDMLR